METNQPYTSVKLSTVCEVWRAPIPVVSRENKTNHNRGNDNW